MSEVHDPYGGCEVTCSHDLAHTATAKELHDGDGPYPADHPLFSTDPALRRWIASRLAANHGDRTDRSI